MMEVAFHCIHIFIHVKQVLYSIVISYHLSFYAPTDFGPFTLPQLPGEWSKTYPEKSSEIDGAVCLQARCPS